ncbi:S41 family peptidase [Puia dinghuensis]|uniref:Tail specific protease domain-containing protein n=1 Tax=Puia dinghuensis TaxID=1792502 RepID=A0A8J2XSJ8_9BACT|nr:S41 family peptidase [Puia dinghuensis]GGA95894.1 hypothetical protein GCM10011511_18960 [Puia dinghuensis]
MKKPLFYVVAALLSATCTFCTAQEQPGNTPLVITPAIVHSLIDSLRHSLGQHYIFPDTAQKMVAYLETEYRKGAYAEIKNPQQLAERLWRDLEKAHHDGHLHLGYQPQFARQLANTDTTGAAQRQKDGYAHALVQEGEANFGFEKVEILRGNIGYVKFNHFTGLADEAMATFTSAFRFVAHTNALIIDMRTNGGGSPFMVSRAESYFFPVRTHMMDIINRSSGKNELWTDPAKTDSTLLQMPVYILTSKRTFSGAEDFSYGMQSIHRAVVVGDTTGGGAHPTGAYNVGFGFVASIPHARSLDPYTHTDWEGTGVYPDIPVTSDKALETAEAAIFTAQLQKATTEEEKRRAQWQLNNIQARQSKEKPDPATLAPYTGVYQGGLDFYVREGDLYCKNAERGGEVFKLLYISPDNYVLDENVVVEFVKDPSGKITGINMHWSNGGLSFKSLQPASPASDTSSPH